MKTIEDLMTFGLMLKHIKYFLVGSFILLAVYLLCGCATKQPYYTTCEGFMLQMNELYCEDATLTGFTAAYLGHDEWTKLTDAYNKARTESKFGMSCKPWNGHWYGRTIREESLTELVK
jgi:hypothetical protein